MSALATYSEFIVENNLHLDQDFLRYEMVQVLLRACGVKIEFALNSCLENQYFLEDQLGDIDKMTPGAIDVRFLGSFW